MKKFILLMLVFFATVAYSQENTLERFQFGIYGDVNFNMHSPDFILSEPGFTLFSPTDTAVFNENTIAPYFDLGAVVKYEINDMFTVSGRLGYNAMSAVLTDASDNDLETSLGYFEITPSVEVYELFPVKEVYLTGGLEFGIPVSNSVKYEDFDETDIDEASARVALAVGAGYQYEVSHNVFLNPPDLFRLLFPKLAPCILCFFFQAEDGIRDT